MSYGLKCYTGGGYLSFDADQMDSFVRVIVSGSIYLASGESITIDAPGYQYVYTLTQTTSYSERSHEIDRFTNYFIITNTSASTVIGYIAYKL